MAGDKTEPNTKRRSTPIHRSVEEGKCPVMFNQRPCGLQLFRIGSLDESLKPAFDVYECARDIKRIIFRKGSPEKRNGNSTVD
jgi:hypothetical protein